MRRMMTGKRRTSKNMGPKRTALSLAIRFDSSSSVPRHMATCETASFFLRAGRKGQSASARMRPKASQKLPGRRQAIKLRKRTKW